MNNNSVIQGNDNTGAKGIIVKEMPFFFFCLLMALTLRIIGLKADPPIDLSSSLGIFGDETVYLLGARNNYLFGGNFINGIEFPYSGHYLNGVWSLVHLLNFNLFGVGLEQVRMVSVFFALLSLTAVYFLSQKYMSPRARKYALVIFSVNFMLIMYNRLALVESMILFFMIISFFSILEYKKKKAVLWLFVSGVACSIAVISKVTYAYFGLVCVFFLLYKCYKKELEFKTALSFVVGALIPFLLWIILWIIPKYPYIELYKSEQSYFYGRLMPHSIEQLFFNIVTFFYSQNIFMLMPFATFSFLIFLCAQIKKNKPLSDFEIILLIWIALGSLEFMFISYKPLRYYMTLTVPIILLAAVSLDNFKKYVFVILERKIAIFIFVLLCALFFSNARIFFQLDHLKFVVGYLFVLAGVLALCFWLRGEARLKKINYERAGLIFFCLLILNHSFHWVNWYQKREYVGLDHSYKIEKIVGDKALLADTVLCPVGFETNIPMVVRYDFGFTAKDFEQLVSKYQPDYFLFWDKKDDVSKSKIAYLENNGKFVDEFIMHHMIYSDISFKLFKIKKKSTSK